MIPMSRREFLGAASLGAAALGSADAPAIIDAHTHFYDPTRPQGVPWPGRDDRVLYRPVLPEHFQRLAGPLGVTGTVVVEASPWVEDNQWLLDLASRHEIVVGVVGRLVPESDDFARNLDRFARQCRFRGLRLNHNELQRGLGQRQFDAALRELAERDLALDVNGGPGLLADVPRLARAHPRLRIVVNHAANVPIDGRAVPAEWAAGVRAAAEQPLVFCKVSALVEATGRREGNAPRDVAYYRPVLDALWAAFGPERLIYASNWPVGDRAADYRTVLGIVRDYVQALGADASVRFFAGNAALAYKWPAR